MAGTERDANVPAVLGAESLGTGNPFEGVRRETHRAAKATVTAYSFEAGAAFPLHSHPEEQITVFLDGEVEVTMAGTTRTFRPGETCVIAPEVEHGMTAGPGGARFVAMIVPPRERADAYRVKGEDDEDEDGAPGE